MSFGWRPIFQPSITEASSSFVVICSRFEREENWAKKKGKIEHVTICSRCFVWQSSCVAVSAQDRRAYSRALGLALAVHLVRLGMKSHGLAKKAGTRPHSRTNSVALYTHRARVSKYKPRPAGTHTHTRTHTRPYRWCSIWSRHRQFGAAPELRCSIALWSCGTMACSSQWNPHPANWIFSSKKETNKQTNQPTNHEIDHSVSPWLCHRPQLDAFSRIVMNRN